MAATTEAQAEFSLHAVVTAALEDFDDLKPAELAARVAEDLSEEQARAALASLLPAYITKLNRDHRAEIFQPDKPGGQRWSKVTEDQWEITLLRQRVCPRGVWKRLADCDTRDVLDLAADLKHQAEMTSRMATRHMVLGKLMSARGYGAVKDVPKEDLKKIFNA